MASTPPRDDHSGGDSDSSSRGRTFSHGHCGGGGRSAGSRDEDDRQSGHSVHTDRRQTVDPLVPPPRPSCPWRGAASPPILLPPEVGPDGRKIVFVGHLKQPSSGVPKAIAHIFTQRFTGFPHSYFEQSTTEQAEWVAKFAEEYTWIDKTFLPKLHSRFADWYRGTLSNIRHKCRNQRPLDPKNPNYMDWIDIHPPNIRPENWKKLLEYYNTTGFKEESEKNSKNAKSENRSKTKRHGKKSKTSLYEELCIEAGRRLRMEEFGDVWVGKEAKCLDEYKKRLIEKYGDDPKPLFDEDIYKEITGGPKRGRWIGAPPQLVHPEHFEPPQPSRRELELEDQHRRVGVEIRDLKRRVLKLEEKSARIEAENQAHMKAYHREMTAFVNASLSNMWAQLVKAGFVQPHKVPRDMVTGSSTQGPLRPPSPRPEGPPQLPSPCTDLHLHSTNHFSDTDY